MRLFILIFTGFIAPILLVTLLVTNPLDFGGGKGISLSQNESNVEIVASIDGINITRDEIDRAAEDNFETLIQVPEAQQTFFLSSLVAIQKIAARNAISEGLANSDAVQQRLAYQKEKILHDIWVAEQTHARVTENDIRAYFDTYVVPELAKQNENIEEVQARHILVATQGEAETVIKRLEKGEDFAALAGELSLGPSASRGGDLGYFLAEEMVQAFSDAAFALQPGNFQPL